MAGDTGRRVGGRQEARDARCLENMSLSSGKQTARLLSALPHGPTDRLPPFKEAGNLGLRAKSPQCKSWFII